VLTLPAAPGKYLVQAKLTLTDNSGGNAGLPTCTVGYVGPEALLVPVDKIQVGVPASTTSTRLPLSLLGTFEVGTAGSFELHCTTDAPSDQDKLRARDVTLTATQVGAVG